MTHNSHKVWKTIRKLSNDPTTSNPPCLVSANQVAHQLLVNGRGAMPSQPKRPILPTATEGDYSMVYPFSEEEYRNGVAILKNNKAYGRYDVLVEQLNNLDPKSHRWLLTMLNKCIMENKIPTLWRQFKIIPILKPGEDSAIPKSFIPISLLCYTYKLYERMILNRIAPTIEQHLINEQAGFRPGKSCTSQLLNLTQHIEDGYQEGMTTGTACVDLSAVCDTVNHILLIQKLFNITQDSTLCRVIQNLLSNRRFYVELNNERSRRRLQQNGLPQESVLFPNPFQHIHQYSASPWWNKELHLCRWPVHHSPVPYLLTSREYYWRGIGWTHRVLRKQQSACQSWQDVSHLVSSTEQRGKEIIESIMERSWPRECYSS